MGWMISLLHAFLGSVPGVKYSVLGFGHSAQVRVPVRGQMATLIRSDGSSK